MKAPCGSTGKAQRNSQCAKLILPETAMGVWADETYATRQRFAWDCSMQLTLTCWLHQCPQACLSRLQLAVTHISKKRRAQGARFSGRQDCTQSTLCNTAPERRLLQMYARYWNSVTELQKAKGNFREKQVSHIEELWSIIFPSNLVPRRFRYTYRHFVRAGEQLYSIPEIESTRKQLWYVFFSRVRS